jgi:hypothetical protein
LIRHLVKGAASYTFDNGLQFGGTYNWNSGTVASRTFLASARNLPIRVAPSEAFEFAGYTTRWLAPNAVGNLTNPSWGQIDLRAQYNRRIMGDTAVEFFVDLFNILDNQSAVRTQDLVAGQGSNAFGDEILWVNPRRAFLGARVKF